MSGRVSSEPKRKKKMGPQPRSKLNRACRAVQEEKRERKQWTNQTLEQYGQTQNSRRDEVSQRANERKSDLKGGRKRKSKNAGSPLRIQRKKNRRAKRAKPRRHGATCGSRNKGGKLYRREWKENSGAEEHLSE